MKIAELFVNLGIQGDERTLTSLTAIEATMAGVGLAALSAITALAGVGYAIKKMGEDSGKTGAELNNFQALTGMSAKTLQQYEYQTRLAGGTNEDAVASFKGLQKAMTDIYLNKAPPDFWPMFTDQLNKLGIAWDRNRIRDIPYMLGLINQAAKGLTPGVFEQFGKGFGLTENFMAAMREGRFEPKKLAAAPILSEGAIKQLQYVNEAWERTATHIKMAFDHFQAMHGIELAKDVGRMTDAVIKLAEALVKLSDAIHLLPAVTSLTGHVAGAMDDLSNVIAKPSFSGVFDLYKDFLSFSPQYQIGKFMTEHVVPLIGGKAATPVTQTQHNTSHFHLKDANEIAPVQKNFKDQNNEFFQYNPYKNRGS